MKKRHILFIQGQHREWGFDVVVDPRHLAEWQADGLCIYATENTIPVWVVGAGLARPWCFLQDLFHFRNPFK